VPLRVLGWGNVALLGGVVAVVLLQGIWQPGEVALVGQHLGAERLVGMLALAGIGGVSLRVTSNHAHRQNMFSWAPFAEVAKLFAAIFCTMAPVVAMLHAGEQGALAGVVKLANAQGGQPVPAAYFWLTGLLSAFLDNAPTYLVFFELAGGDPAVMVGERARTLLAISTGAVFFGALTYIGNAPNFMVRSIASHRGVRMPGFLGFIGWSAVLMLPGLALVSWVFF
jgi:Na+/H+ antiporter NhaD/arsenite permease-like protein